MDYSDKKIFKISNVSREFGPIPVRPRIQFKVSYRKGKASFFFLFWHGKPCVPEGSSARQAMFIIAKEASRMDNEATNHSFFYIPMRHRGTVSMGSIGLAEPIVFSEKGSRTHQYLGKSTEMFEFGTITL